LSSGYGPVDPYFIENEVRRGSIYAHLDLFDSRTGASFHGLLNRLNIPCFALTGGAIAIDDLEHSAGQP
jgi:hypothetical protein